MNRYNLIVSGCYAVNIAKSFVLSIIRLEKLLYFKLYCSDVLMDLRLEDNDKDL